MNLVHVHLLLNHFPTIGTTLSVGLLLFGVLRSDDTLKRVSLTLLFLLALVSILTYTSGDAAWERVLNRPDVSEALATRHKDAAFVALIFVQLTGAFSWYGLWQSRRVGRTLNGNLTVVVLLALVTLGLMARAANRGGEIGHAEIRPETGVAEVVAPSPGLLTTATVQNFIGDYNWAWPAAEAIHFVGLSLLLGVLLVVNLRLLGAFGAASFRSVHRLLPWGMLGLAVNIVTGMLFFIAAPDQYTENVSFHWKMALLMLAGIGMLYMTVSDEIEDLRAGDRAPILAQVFAASTILLTVGVTYFGRMLPFLGTAF